MISTMLSGVLHWESTPSFFPTAGFGHQQLQARLLSTVGDSLSAAHKRELESLSGEEDPELYHQGLLVLAGRMERLHQEESALAIYQAQIDHLEIMNGRQPQILQSSRSRRDALVGTEGSFGARVEVLTRSFVREAIHPASLIGMAGAQAIFGLSRATILSRLTESSLSSAFTRGAGARLSASAGAFMIEAPSFTVMTRSASALLEKGPHWGTAGLGKETLAAYFSLGALRLGGSTASSAYRRLADLKAQITMTRAQSLLTQAGMFGGILLGHEMEIQAGLRDHQNSANTMADSLAMLLQFNMAGRLLHGLTPGLGWMSQELHWRGELAGTKAPLLAANGPNYPLPIDLDLHPRKMEQLAANDGYYEASWKIVSGDFFEPSMVNQVLASNKDTKFGSRSDSPSGTGLTLRGGEDIYRQPSLQQGPESLVKERKDLEKQLSTSILNSRMDIAAERIAEIDRELFYEGLPASRISKRHNSPSFTMIRAQLLELENLPRLLLAARGIETYADCLILTKNREKMEEGINLLLDFAEFLTSQRLSFNEHGMPSFGKRRVQNERIHLTRITRVVNQLTRLSEPGPETRKRMIRLIGEISERYIDHCYVYVESELVLSNSKFAIGRKMKSDLVLRRSSTRILEKLLGMETTFHHRTEIRALLEKLKIRDQLKSVNFTEFLREAARSGVPMAAASAVSYLIGTSSLFGVLVGWGLLTIISYRMRTVSGHVILPEYALIMSIAEAMGVTVYGEGPEALPAIRKARELKEKNE